MNRPGISILLFLCLNTINISGYPQGLSDALNKIDSSDLRKHISFLSSPQLQGRMNGSPGLDMATEYLAGESEKTGLIPANTNSFFQEFSITIKKYDPLVTNIAINFGNDLPEIIDKPFYEIVPTGISKLDIEGEVVFAGYGINSYKYNYNDFNGIETEGKIVMIMNRAPMSEDGRECFF